MARISEAHRPSVVFPSSFTSQVVAGCDLGEQQLMLATYGAANDFLMENRRLGVTKHTVSLPLF